MYTHMPDQHTIQNSRHEVERNRVFMDNEDVLVNKYVGDQTPESIRQVRTRSQEYINALHGAGKSGIVLVDLSQMGRTSAAARREAVETLRSTQFDKVALYGASLYMKHLSQLIVMAAGQGHRVRYFDTEDEARKWLHTVPENTQ
jgi:hypothetical protein